MNTQIIAIANQKGPETVTHLAELPVSRRFGAGLYPNYERDIYLQVKVTGGGICYFRDVYKRQLYSRRGGQQGVDVW